MKKAHIVLVEDEPAIRHGVADALTLSGFEVSQAEDGQRGAELATQGGVNLVLLDLLLPIKDGLAVLAEVRRICPHRPVIILTARGDEDDRVRGLEMGADDYVVKPFSARELIARVEAVLRRSSSKQGDLPMIKFGRGTLDLQRREMRWSDDERTELSETEAALLSYLISNRDRAVSREELLTRVWGIGTAGLETRAIDMHIARLRAKLKDPSGQSTGELVVTVRSHGYMAGPGLTFNDEDEK